MIWTGTIFTTLPETEGAGPGYFSLAGLPEPAQAVTLDYGSTPGLMAFRAPGYAAAMHVFGSGLALDWIGLPDGSDLPVFTAGEITGITFEYNHARARAAAAGEAETPFHAAAFLEPVAALQLPGVAAAGLSAALLDSLLGASPEPWQAYRAQVSLHYEGSASGTAITGAGGADSLRGHDGADRLTGGLGADLLIGGGGSDLLRGGAGADLYRPGPGGAAGDRVEDTGTTPGEIDTLSYAGAPEGLTIDLDLADGSHGTGWAADLVVSGIERVIGSDFDDIVIGRRLGPEIGDILIGGAGDDTLAGLDGDDTLEGGRGFDLLLGGGIARDIPGYRDVARYAASSAQIALFDRADGMVEIASPGGGLDRLAGIERLALSDGLFDLAALPRADRGLLLLGAAGNDSLSGGAADELLFGRQGHDRLSGGAGHDSLDGGPGQDRLEGGAGDDALDGGMGDDHLLGGPGIDTAWLAGPVAAAAVSLLSDRQLRVVTALGDDTIGQDVEWIAFDDGPLSFAALRARAGITGTALAEALSGSNGADLIRALGGNDWITPGAGSDSIDGGAGRDMVSFVTLGDTPGRAAGAYRLDLDLSSGRAETSGADLYHLTQVESVTGTIHADRMRGDAGDNHFRGLGDYDWFTASFGADSYDGGSGRDMVSYVTATGPVTVDLGAGRGLAGLAAGDSYASIERITGSRFGDLFYGDDGPNDFRGLGGYDLFMSSPGGRERYDGGAGIDTVSYGAAAAGIAASLLRGYGTRGDAALDLYSAIENLTGSAFADVLGGDHARNILQGLGGDDLILGEGGTDRLSGGPGDDTLMGGAGSDYALFEGMRAEYRITRTGTRDAEVVWIGPGEGAGRDLLYEVEYLVFADDTLDIWSL